MTDFGARLKHFRERAGLSQAQLGAAIGVGQSAVANWECGDPPRHNNMEAAIRACGVDWIVFWATTVEARAD